jgi:hypothetical protein
MNTRWALNLICAVTACALAASASVAATITTGDGNGADTYVTNDSQHASTTTHGGETGTAIRHFDGTRRKLMYIRFDLSSIAGSRTGAILTTYFTGSNRDRTMNVYGLTDSAVDDLWSEATTNYENAPGIVQPAGGGVAYNSGNATLDLTKLTLLGTFLTNGGVGDKISNVAALNLDAFLAADTNNLVTFVLDTATSDSSQSFFVATKENVSGAPILPPRLTLPNAAVPEPAGIAGLTLAMACIAHRRRADAA